MRVGLLVIFIFQIIIQTFVELREILYLESYSCSNVNIVTTLAILHLMLEFICDLLSRGWKIPFTMFKTVFKDMGKIDGKCITDA